MTSTQTIGPQPPRVQQPDALAHLGLPCRAPGVDPDLFYSAGGPLAVGQVKQARALCQSCPIVVPCREFALANNEEYGVWGGTTREQRKAIRRVRRSWDQDPEAAAS